MNLNELLDELLAIVAEMHRSLDRTEKVLREALFHQEEHQSL